MRLIKSMALLTLICLILCGCQVSGEVENQAYVLALGIERLDNEALQLTARVPKIGKSEPESGGESSGGSPYLTFAVSAPTWPQALETLQQSTPRRINLSHIELLVVSRSLAEETDFPDLTRQIAQTPHLYTTASFVICEGSAGQFIDAGETIIGTRLSAELRAMLRHYVDQGYIPDSSFAEADYAVSSIYSDPVAIWGYLNGAASRADSGQFLKTPMEQRYLGAALLRRGIFIRALSLGETQLLNLVRGRSKPFLFEWEGGSYELTPSSTPRKTVAWQGDSPRLVFQAALTVQEELPDEALARLANALKQGVEALIAGCQREVCDPFGYAEIASGRFSTVRQWLDFDWRTHYAKAAVDISIEIHAAQAG